MTLPENDASLEPDGERFLNELDAVLEGQEPSGEHAESARFAAQLAGVLQSQEGAAPENVRQKIEAASRPVAVRKASTVVRMDQALRRFRLGVLDLAAIVAISVLGVLIWRGLQKEPQQHPAENAAPKDARLAAEDSKPPAPKPVEPEIKIEPAPRGEQEWEKAIRAKLEKKISVDFVDTPVGEIVGFLRAITLVNIVLDPKTAHNGAVNRVVSFRAQDMSAATVLEWVLRLANLESDLRNQVVYIGENLKKRVEVRMYDLHGLPISADLMCNVVRNAPMQFSFSEEGGTSADVLKGSLLVMQTEANQAFILNMIAAVRNQAATGQIDFQTRPQPEWKKQLLVKLERKMTFEFVDTPLEDALGFFRSLSNISIVIDPKALIKAPPLITLRVQDMELKQALEHTLRLADLDYRLESGVVLVSLPKSDPVEVMGYKVEELIKSRGFTESDIVKTIQTTIEPESWGRVQGKSIVYGEGWIFVVNTPAVQEKTAALLQKLLKPEKP